MYFPIGVSDDFIEAREVFQDSSPVQFDAGMLDKHR